MDVEFEIPSGLSHKNIATIFAAYINPFSIGMPSRVGFGDHEEEDKVGYSRWMLDGGNDYWLVFDKGKGFLRCRYPYQVEILQAMKALFELRWGKRWGK